MQSQHDYHRELAASLMVSIGYEDAVEWAFANQWEGFWSNSGHCHATIQSEML
jgi:hypothetical protein